MFPHRGTEWERNSKAKSVVLLFSGATTQKRLKTKTVEFTAEMLHQGFSSAIKS